MKREPPPNLAFQISATHLCHVLRINTPRLSELTERGIIRRGVDEKGGPITSGYRFDTALNDYHDYLLAEARGKGWNAFEAARARMASVKAEIASMKLAAMQGEFVDANEAAEVFRTIWARRTANFRLRIVGEQIMTSRCGVHPVTGFSIRILGWNNRANGGRRSLTRPIGCARRGSSFQRLNVQMASDLLMNSTSTEAGGSVYAMIGGKCAIT